MKPTLPSFYDLRTRTTYTIADNILSTHTKKPKIVSIICPPLMYFTHITLEVEKTSLFAPNISSLLFALAYQKSVLSDSPHFYELYFTSRAHLYDEQKCICECFFYHKIQSSQHSLPVPKAHIITCDIFLPYALSAFDIQADFIVWIESFLCYFEKGILKEVLSCDTQNQHTNLTESNQDEIHTRISTHIIYLQEAYHQHFTHIYYFMEESTNPLTLLSQANADSLLISAPHAKSQMLHIAPLSHICEYTRDLDMKNFRATLALHYASLQQNDLPNFAPKPNPRKKIYYGLAIACIVFICIIPLSLILYNYSLQRAIAEINTQSESLFVDNELESSPSHTYPATNDTLQALARKQEQLITNLQYLTLWQQSYNNRYAFIQEILDAHTASIDYDDVAFYFSPSVFLASLKVSAESQIHISTLLANLNTDTHRAFLRDSIKDSVIEDAQIESSRFYAHIIVVYYAV